MRNHLIDVQDLFSRTSRDLSASLEEARKRYAGHSGAVGKNVEEGFRLFLEHRLPRAFAVGKGFVFESGGKRSLEQDVVIYDSLHHPRLVVERDECLLPVDSVVAIFEVKAVLDKQKMQDAVSKIASVKSLKRNVRNQIPGTLSGTEVIPVRGYIFAYETRYTKARTVAERFADAVRKYSPELRPDAMLVKQKWWFDWVDDKRSNAKHSDTPAGLRIVDIGEYDLLQLWTRLMDHLSWHTIPTPLDWIDIPSWGSTQFRADYLEFGG